MAKKVASTRVGKTVARKSARKASATKKSARSRPQASTKKRASSTSKPQKRAVVSKRKRPIAYAPKTKPRSPAASKKGATKRKAAAKKLSGKCFTIMPYGNWFDSYYDAIYKPAIVSTGLSANRADDLYRPSQIIGDIWAFTRKADVILADLTGKNPNVFYELGLAHAIAKPAVLVTESMEDVPFDLRSLRVLEYDKNDPNWGATLKADIAKALREVMASPLESVPPTFIKVKADGKALLTRSEKELLTIRRDLDSLKRQTASSAHSRESRRIPMHEAEERIQSYLSLGLDPEAIFRRLTQVGVPSIWLESRLEEIKKDNR